MTASNTAVALMKLRQTFAKHGLACVLVSDNGTAFISQEFQSFCRRNGIKHIRSAPYHPMSNDSAGSAIQTLMEGLNKTLGPDLETRMYRFLSRYCVIPQTTTGQSPAEMLMMRRPRLRLDLAYPALDNGVLDIQTVAWEHHEVALPPREFWW